MLRISGNHGQGQVHLRTDDARRPTRVPIHTQLLQQKDHRPPTGHHSTVSFTHQNHSIAAHESKNQSTLTMATSRAHLASPSANWRHRVSTAEMKIRSDSWEHGGVPPADLLFPQRKLKAAAKHGPVSVTTPVFRSINPCAQDQD